MTGRNNGNASADKGGTKNRRAGLVHSASRNYSDTRLGLIITLRRQIICQRLEIVRKLVLWATAGVAEGQETIGIPVGDEKTNTAFQLEEMREKIKQAIMSSSQTLFIASSKVRFDLQI